MDSWLFYFLSNFFLLVNFIYRRRRKSNNESAEYYINSHSAYQHYIWNNIPLQQQKLYNLYAHSADKKIRALLRPIFWFSLPSSFKFFSWGWYSSYYEY